MAGYSGRMAEVDLTTRKVSQRSLPEEDLRLYLGGKGLGVRLLYDGTLPGIDPLGPENHLIFATGPANGTGAPQSNRFCVVTKSPLTGGIATSTCGGDLATDLRLAGLDVLVVRGAADSPVAIEVNDGAIEIKDAAHLAGKTTSETQAAFPEKWGKAVIGPAGENLVRFAAIVSGTRVAARCGVGAVMGSKKLKAVVAHGRARVEVADRPRFKEEQRWLTEYLRGHPMTGEILPRLGTANLVLTTAGRNIIPTRNFQKGHGEWTPRLSGEEMAARHLVKNDGCRSCPIKCGRVVRYRSGKVGKGPEFETIGLMGNNLGLGSLEDVFELADLCDEIGVDAISMGGTLGFACELAERGMVDWPLRFGDAGALRRAVEDTALRRGIGAELAEGTRRMAQKFGGRDFAINVKGLELPAYDPRGCYGQGLEYATTNRGGCHIQGGTMYLEATGPLTIDPHSTAAKPELVILQQNLFAAMASMVMCAFSAYAMLPPAVFSLDPKGPFYRAITAAALWAGPVLRLALKFPAPISFLWYERLLSAILGDRWTFGRVAETGERVFNLERLYNLREGFSRAEDTLPRRLLEEPTFKGFASGVPLDEMLPRYYAVRGWNEDGVPTEATLSRLKIRR